MDVTITKTNKFLCRICALTNFSFSIFSEQGKELELQNKITFCLGIKVLENDHLPKHICYDCVGKLSLLYDFKQTFVNAQAKITCIFDNKTPSDKPEQNGIDKDDVINLTDEAPEDNENEEENGLDNVIIQSVESLATPSNKFTRTPSPDSSSSQSEKRKSIEPTEEKESKKKDRKTVCVTCGKWISRVELVNHEETVHFKKGLSCSKCSIDFETLTLWTEHAQNFHATVS